MATRLYAVYECDSCHKRVAGEKRTVCFIDGLPGVYEGSLPMGWIRDAEDNLTCPDCAKWEANMLEGSDDK